MAKGVPPQPLWLLYIKIAILALSLIILALAAWHLSLFGGYAYYGSGAGGMDIFVVCVLSSVCHAAMLTGRVGHPELHRLRRRRCGRDLGAPVLLLHRLLYRLHPLHHLLAFRVGVVGELCVGLAGPR